MMAKDDTKTSAQEDPIDPSRRSVLKGIGAAAAGLAAAGAASAQAAAAQQAADACEDKNPYAAPPGSGISMPPYYRPTPSIKNNNNFFPQTEELGADEMRITFLGSNPFPPRLTQAGTAIMVELGNGDRLFFDFGSGCLRNIIGLQIPIPQVNDIFLSHLHVDHFADLPYLYAFAPFMMRWKPLRVVGPSGRTPKLGTKAMVNAMEQMCAWHKESFTSLPVGDGYETEVTEFDFKDDNGICYEKNGVTVRHWRRSHTMDGASAYRLDWNGLSFVWTGDGKPDQLTAKFAKGCDVLVSEMVVDNPALWSLKQGAPQTIGSFTIDSGHSPGYGVGYLAAQVNPRVAMATHFSWDRELIGEAVAEVRTHWKGLFEFGIDLTVVNVTKDAVWIREAAVPTTANQTKPSAKWIIQENFGGVIPTQLPKPPHTIAEVQEKSVRDLEINPDVFTPPDQIRPWVREWPTNLSPAQLMGQPPPTKS